MILAAITRRALAFPLLAALVAGASSAQTVISFDGARCYGGSYQYWLTGDGMDGPRNELLAQGYTVQAPVSFLDSAALSNGALFVTGLFQLGGVLSPSEATDLVNWVAAGGGLLFIGENAAFQSSNDQFVSLFNAGSFGGNSSGSQVTIVAPAHPIISGPFGTVTSLSPLAAAGRWTNTPANVTTVATNTDGSGAVLAFGFGSGRVVFVNDVNYFCNPPSFSAEHVELWNNTVEWLTSAVCTGSAASYCTAGTTSHGCVPSFTASGTPSLAASSGFTLTCSSMEGQRSGIVYFGILGPFVQPWATGSTSFLCVKAPVQRTPTQSSGGTFNACDGVLSLDFLAFMAANPNALGQPMTAGQTFDAQAWFRDPPAPKSTNLSDALHWQMCP